MKWVFTHVATSQMRAMYSCVYTYMYGKQGMYKKEDKDWYGVYCHFPPISVVPDNPYPVVLAGGNHASEGTVLIQYDGQWGTICDDHWTLTEAIVVCQQLGFPGAQSAVSGGRYVYT